MAEKDADAFEAAVAAVRSETLGTLVLRRLRQMILNGELRPGDKVNEVVVARTLGVSRGPVREACRQLVQAGLLEAKVQRGTFVRRVSAEEAESCFEIRTALYELAGRLLAPRITDEQIAEIESVIDRMEAACAAGDVEAYYPLNRQIHETLLSAAGNQKLFDVYFDCGQQVRLFRLDRMKRDAGYQREATKIFRESLDGRKRTLAAIKTGDSEKVAESMRRQATESRNRTRRLVDRLAEQSGDDTPQVA